MSGCVRVQAARRAPVEQKDLLAAAAVSALLDAGEVEQLSSYLLLRCEHDAVLCENAEDGTGVRDSLHGILD